MMEAAPAASLVVSKAQFLFQLLIIALDPPAQLGQSDQAIEPLCQGVGARPAWAATCLGTIRNSVRDWAVEPIRPWLR